MPTYLDYFRNENNETLFLSLIDDAGLTVDFYQDGLEGVIYELTGSEYIVVYDRPLIAIKRVTDEESLEHWNVRERWFDMFRKLKENTGLELSLTKIAKASLGEGPQSDVTRLQTPIRSIATADIIQQVHDRLTTIKSVYDYAIASGFLQYSHGGNISSTEVDFS